MNLIQISFDGVAWEPIDRAKAIASLSGYWKPETIEPMLADGQKLWTPNAQYQEGNVADMPALVLEKVDKLMWPYMGPTVARRFRSARQASSFLLADSGNGGMSRAVTVNSDLFAEHPALTIARRHAEAYDEENLINAAAVAKWRRVKAEVLALIEAVTLTPVGEVAA